LAIPLVVSIATERAARGGVLVKDRLALERMRTVDTVLFDKTGTLTTGEPAVVAVVGTAGVEEDEVLALAAAVEAPSEHPLARAVVRAAEAHGVTGSPASEFRARTGVGVTGTEIGRASCRERVSSSVAAGGWNETREKRGREGHQCG